jgi:hypothetical protein
MINVSDTKQQFIYTQAYWKDRADIIVSDEIEIKGIITMLAQNNERIRY